MKNKKIFKIITVILCMLFILLGMYVYNKINNKNNKEIIKEAKSIEQIKTYFNNIFDNKLKNNDKENYDKIKRINVNKNNLVYTAYENELNEDGKYEINVKIPLINIKSTVIDKLNENTQKIFADKANNIIEGDKENIIYSIDYTAFINNGILSVIIKSTLKEQNNPQRVIIETYNYNLLTNEEIKFNDIVKKRKLNNETIEKKIYNDISKIIKEENKIQLSGYETFSREVNQDIYKVNNIENFFIGDENRLYIVFAYGNNNYTSEIDIIEI